MSPRKSARDIRKTRFSGELAGNLGTGPAQRIALPELANALKPFISGQTVKPSGASGSGQPFSPHGFGFFIGGLMLADELLGGVIFPHNMSFGSDSPYTIVSKSPAAASATFKLMSGTPDVQIGTIVFAAGSKTGVLTWSSPPFLLASGTQLELRSPSPADSTLAYVSGNVTGAIGS